MIITFPCIVSETVDKEILPYILKAIERYYALMYVPKIQLYIQGKISENTLIKNLNNEKTEKIKRYKYLETDNDTSIGGIQVIHSETNKINIEQPYYIVFRININRNTYDFVAGFKCVALIIYEAYEVFKNSFGPQQSGFISDIKSAFKQIVNRLKNRLEDDLNEQTEEIKKKTEEKVETMLKTIQSMPNEKIIILSSSDFNSEAFLRGEEVDEIVISDLENSMFDSLYIDNKPMKKVFFVNKNNLPYCNIISYDMLYKSTLNVTSEMLEKAKERNVSLFSRKAPIWLVNF